jgi:hypothetical protein
MSTATSTPRPKSRSRFRERDKEERSHIERLTFLVEGGGASTR